MSWDERGIDLSVDADVDVDLDDFVTKSSAILIARHAGRSAANDVLSAIGVDASTPEARIAAAADARYLRRTRTASEQLPVLFKRAAIPVLVAALAAAIWAGITHIE